MRYLYYILQLADNALIMGQRLGEWCGHAPILEQDIALTNIALDDVGQARSLYQYASDVFNSLPEAEKATVFASPLLQQVDGPVAEDDFAGLRDSWDFRNILLVEQPNGDWAQTVVRSFFFDTFQFLLYTELAKSPDAQLAAIAEKSLKEVAYHKRWSSEWMIRLGDGTGESHQRIREAVDKLWPYAGEMFVPAAAETFAFEVGIGPDVASLKDSWHSEVASILKESTLEVPDNKWTQQGGKEGRHSEHLGYILSDLQFMQRAYPGMEW